MDLISGYDSDSNGSGDEQVPSGGKPSTATGLQASAATHAQQPAAAGNGDVDVPFSKLPTPKVNELAAKRVISFQLPLNRQMLQAPDSDDDEAEAAERRAKRLKAANKTKSKLMDYLPPPKGVALGGGLGAGAAGGARGRAAFGRSRDDDDDDEDDPVLAAGRGDGGAAAVGLNSNEAYRAADEEWVAGEEDAAGAGPGPSSWAGYGAADAGSAGYAQPQYYAAPGAAPPPRAKQPQQQQQPAGFELPAELAGVQFKEINAKELRHVDPAVKEAANSARSALGAEYANQLRSQATGHQGNKLARNKHQIGTLYYNAKMNEIDLLEGKANSMKTKAETQAKYGW